MTAVWELILESCAEMFGMTVRGRLAQLIGYCLTLFVIGLVLSMRWGYAAWGVPVLLVAFAVAAARQVWTARNTLWRATSAGLDEAGRPLDDVAGRILAPTAVSLYRLAEAVVAVRLGRYVIASEQVPLIQRDLLRPEEAQLFEAVRAMISMGLGSTQRAAQQAVAALPTGSDELDTCLGRTLVADAWNDSGRLAAIQRAWDQAGVSAGPLARLRSLVRIRLDASRIEAIETPEARELSDEARAIGDDELASELDARSRPAAYR
jgi:hypothetical protein